MTVSTHVDVSPNSATSKNVSLATNLRLVKSEKEPLVGITPVKWLFDRSLYCRRKKATKSYSWKKIVPVKSDSKLIKKAN